MQSQAAAPQGAGHYPNPYLVYGAPSGFAPLTDEAGVARAGGQVDAGIVNHRGLSQLCLLDVIWVCHCDLLVSSPRPLRATGALGAGVAQPRKEASGNPEGSSSAKQKFSGSSVVSVGEIPA